MRTSNNRPQLSLVTPTSTRKGVTETYPGIRIPCPRLLLSKVSPGRCGGCWESGVPQAFSWQCDSNPP
jgi:hypothetical protein